MTKKDRIRKMRRGLLGWFRRSGRDLPWRNTSDPYAILVSEVMLQQTQVARVIPKYHAFLAKFPHWRALAKAGQADVVRMWHGLGYNRRAMALHKLAITLTAPTTPDPSFGRRRELPHDHGELVKLPGIGEYTAEAVRAFAFRAKGAAPVDTNIERILKRVFGAHTKSRKEIQALAQAVVPADVWSWNHGLWIALFARGLSG